MLRYLRRKFLGPVLAKETTLEEKIDILFKEIIDIRSRLESNQKNAGGGGISFDEIYDFFATAPKKAERFINYIFTYIVKRGSCVIDVGANHGMHTIPLSKLVGTEGKVIACDAVAKNIDSIKVKSTLNNIEYFQAAITKPEIAESQKNIEFYYFPKWDGCSGIKKRSDTKEEWGEELITVVPTATLDTVVYKQASLGARVISFIKIDVEGGEFDVLLGAENIMLEHKPLIVIEFSRSAAGLYGYTKQDFFAFFRKVDYKLFQFIEGKFTDEVFVSPKKIYWQLWCVHNDSIYIDFFENKYKTVLEIFIKNFPENIVKSV